MRCSKPDSVGPRQAAACAFAGSPQLSQGRPSVNLCRFDSDLREASGMSGYDGAYSYGYGYADYLGPGPAYAYYGYGYEYPPYGQAGYGGFLYYGPYYGYSSGYNDPAYRYGGYDDIPSSGPAYPYGYSGTYYLGVGPEVPY